MKCLVKGVGAGSIDGDGGFGILALQHHSVGNHADIADQTHQLDFIGCFGENGGGGGVGHIHAENQLVDGGSFHLGKGFGGFAVNLPAKAALDAVLDGKIFALTGIQIVFKMGITGEKDVTFSVCAYLFGDFGVQLFRAGETQCAVNKVVLIVNDKQIAVHTITSCYFVILP